MSLQENEARDLFGRKVTDANGQSVGTVEGVWTDPSTDRAEFLGIKDGWLSGKVRVVPAGAFQIADSQRAVATATVVILEQTRARKAEVKGRVLR
jgi:sporulation protein YlmC with PRC-barrel domain